MKKGIGEKVLGWFIVAEDDDGAPAAREVEERTEEVVTTSKATKSSSTGTPPGKLPLPQARGAKEESETTLPAVAPGHSHDAPAFAAVYRAAGLDLLSSLPMEATPDVKRSIVGAALHACGVPIDRIVATADAATAALDAYVVQGRRRTDDVLSQAQARIAKLNAEIEEVRELMATQVAAQEELMRSTGIEKARVRAALDFFGPSTRGAAAAQPPRLVRLK
jgi:hypothetical protein